MMSMVQGRLEREEMQHELQITALYKNNATLQNMLDAILKSSRKKTHYTVCCVPLQVNL